MVDFFSRKVYVEKINNLNKIIDDIIKEEIELKTKINENDQNANLVHMLFLQLRKTMSTREHLEQNRQSLMRKYLRLESESTDESGSESDDSD